MAGPRRIILKSASSSSVEEVSRPLRSRSRRQVPSSSSSFTDDDEDDDDGSSSDLMEELETPPSSPMEESVDYSNPLRMTARQRVMAVDQFEEDEPSSNQTAAAMEDVASSATSRKYTEAEMLLRSEKTRRRNQQRDEKLEKSRVETIQRLLQKQGVRSKKLSNVEDESMKTLDSTGSASWTKEPVLSDHTRFWSRLPASDSMVEVGSHLQSYIDNDVKLPLDQLCCSVKGCSNTRMALHPKTQKPVCHQLSCFQAL